MTTKTVKRAEYVCTLRDWISDAKVYRLDPPYTHTDLGTEEEIELEYVIVSAVVVRYTGMPETLIFPAKKTGLGEYAPINMLEIIGERETLDHNHMLERLGYEV